MERGVRKERGKGKGDTERGGEKSSLNNPYFAHCVRHVIEKCWLYSWS